MATRVTTSGARRKAKAMKLMLVLANATNARIPMDKSGNDCRASPPYSGRTTSSWIKPTTSGGTMASTNNVEFDINWFVRLTACG
jgi:hypothetical protein